MDACAGDYAKTSNHIADAADRVDGSRNRGHCGSELCGVVDCVFASRYKSRLWCCTDLKERRPLSLPPHEEFPPILIAPLPAPALHLYPPAPGPSVRCIAIRDDAFEPQALGLRKKSICRRNRARQLLSRDRCSRVPSSKPSEKRSAGSPVMSARKRSLRPTSGCARISTPSIYNRSKAQTHSAADTVLRNRSRRKSGMPSAPLAVSSASKIRDVAAMRDTAAEMVGNRSV